MATAQALVRQTYVLFTEEVLELFTRKRSLFSLAAYIGFTALVFSAIARTLDKAREMAGGRSALEHPQVILSMLRRSVSPELFDVLQQLTGIPAPIVVYQTLTLLMLPSLAALISCDMISIDLYRGTLRYVLLRSSRTAYYLSKILAHTALYAAIHSITMFGLLLVLARNAPDFSAAEHVRVIVSYLLISLPAIFCVVAATAWISSWCKRPMSALIMIHVFWMVLMGIAFKWPAATPFHGKITVGLIAPFRELVVDSAGGMMMWALVFGLIGYCGFIRRDV